jgi:mRNA interferase RelE/StbE
MTPGPGFNRKLKRRAIQILVDVSNGELEGKPLEDHPSVGDLSDCRKVYFDDQEDGPPRFRLVYRLLPNEVETVAVEAVAVGRRRLMEVYVVAARQLGRLVDDDQRHP